MVHTAVFLYKIQTMEELQYKSIGKPIEMKASEKDDGVLHIKAYALAFNNVDSYGDIISPNACDTFLSGDNAARLKFCYQHNSYVVIGKITDKGVDDYGMWFEADILPTTEGKDVQILIKAGAIDEFSIGYYAVKYHYERRDGYDYELRILDEINIIEVSPVTRAANPKAKLVDMKRENIENHNPTNTDDMTELEKAQLDAAEKKAAAAEQKANDLAKNLEEKDEALKTAQKNIDNLDKSVQDQQKSIEDLKKMVKEQPQTFEKAMRAALEEKKEQICAFLKGAGTMVVELKAAFGTGAIAPATSAQVYGVQVDPTIHTVPVLGNAFLLAFGTRTATSNKLTWMEATATKTVGYVNELAENSNNTSVAFVEKQRSMAKIATYMEMSSELENWYEELYNFCVTEGQKAILKQVDGLVWDGEGNDSTKPKEIYGIKGHATAFAALATYADAHIGDVIIDAIAQVRKEGFAANVALVSYATEAKLRGIKDANGNYLYNQITGMFNQVRVIPTEELTDNEILVADTACVEVYMANIYELEFSRKASTDSWRVDFRRHAQVKVPTPKKKGLIYVSNIATAITAITPAA